MIWTYNTYTHVLQGPSEVSLTELRTATEILACLARVATQRNRVTDAALGELVRMLHKHLNFYAVCRREGR
jgi:hypothetical protein